MLFARDEGNKRTDVLSGGEAARMLFCKLMLQKPNVLVLRRADQPPSTWSQSMRSISRCSATRERCCLSRTTTT